jgi:pyruvate ferredoxin oxidoreductase delta subunit
MRDYSKLLNWREEPMSGIIEEPGSSVHYETGSWRSFRPIWDPEKCIQCFHCWAYCPDASILVEDDKVVGIDYAHCKGCGICAKECPPKAGAIEMILESDAKEKECEAAGKS